MLIVLPPIYSILRMHNIKIRIYLKTELNRIRKKVHDISNDQLYCRGMEKRLSLSGPHTILLQPALDFQRIDVMPFCEE